MRITILSLGYFGNSPHKTVFENYAKRLKWKIDLKEIELKNSKNISSEQLKNGEAELILKNLRPSSKLIVLDERGKQFSSIEFAQKISEFALNGESDLTFVIGGADGLSQKILEKSSLKISLGKMVFPHLMVRTMLIEQLYRASTIINQHPYHRE